VFTWFSSSRKRLEVPRLRSRSESDSSTKVDLRELTPELITYLGKAAYLQLIAFENLSAAVATAPSATAKERITRATSLTLAKQHGLTAEIVRAGQAPGEVMDRYSTAIDSFSDRIAGNDWFETLISCHVTTGFIDDFLLRLAEGLPAGSAERVRDVLSADSGAQIIAAEISAAIDASPQLASRLAMWGRRLVGDTMLITRYVLEAPAVASEAEARIEPIFNELIAAHTRRMDALGLTA
jgi:hypothetical protein